MVESKFCFSYYILLSSCTDRKTLFKIGSRCSAREDVEEMFNCSCTMNPLGCNICNLIKISCSIYATAMNIYIFIAVAFIEQLILIRLQYTSPERLN